MSPSKGTYSDLKASNGSVPKKIKMGISEKLIDVKSEENYDFLFDDDDDFNMAALGNPRAEKCTENLDLTQWRRCLVKDIVRDKNTFDLILKVAGSNDQFTNVENQEVTARCYLQGPWSQTNLVVGDILSLNAIWDSNLQAYKIDKDRGFCVTKPDTLISGTSVVDSLFCRRKAVLRERFRGICGNNKVMVIGSLVHELFQIVLKKNLTDISKIKMEGEYLLNSKQTAFILYSNQLKREDIFPQVLHFVRSIHQFMHQYVEKVSPTLYQLSQENFQGCITEIQDIEENLWIPQMGLKGKIDVSVKIHRRQGEAVLSKGILQQENVPLELKTGRASFSVEHKGQLILYQLMLNTLGKRTKSGLLLYLREGIMKEIRGSRNEERDLIRLRNDLTHYLSSFPDFISMPSKLSLGDEHFIQPFELPDPIEHHSACSQCPYANLCCTFVKTDRSLNLSPTHPLNTLSTHINHLTYGHYEYFIKWCHLLMMEEQEDRKSNRLHDLWCQLPESRKKMGRALCNLITSENHVEKEESQYNHKFFLHSNVKDSSGGKTEREVFDFTLSGFSVGEYVIVSTCKRVAIALGFVLELTKTFITISLERNILQKDEQEIFIIDKYESHTGNVFNFTNLGLLLDNTECSARLRKIVIEKETPIYDKKLPSILVTHGYEILKELNDVQKSVALRALTAQKFMLIKGLPGTGKTKTLVAIVRLLHMIGKSVLITSHTHSAVDNILLRLKSLNLPFLRLGSSSRINIELKDHCEEHLRANFKNEAELSQFYDSYKIVGVTCLGSSHPIFLHRRFDFCVVDEATQVMQPTILRPLFFTDRFILVGDPEQLSPLIRSPLGKLRGADESLFHRLDCVEATSELTLQYRMNRTITKLANALTYQGSLKCASSDVALATLHKNKDPLIINEKWLSRTLQSHVDQSVYLVDTQDCSERSYNFAKTILNTTCSIIEETCNEEQLPYSDILRTSSTLSAKNLSKYTNYCEAAIVFHIIKALLKGHFKPQQIGVMAPFRAQVKLLKMSLQHDELYQSSTENIPNGLHFSPIEVNTVDQFQGRDKDIIIYSCTRTGLETCKTADRNRGAEILEDKRRLTVAVTRAKHKFIIIGDVACIEQYTPFQILLKHIPSLCKLKLQDSKLDFQWSSVMDELSKFLNMS